MKKIGLIITAIILSSCQNISEKKYINEPIIPIHKVIQKTNSIKPVKNFVELKKPKVKKLKKNKKTKLKAKVKKIKKQNALDTFLKSDILKYGNVSFYAIDLKNGKTIAKFQENKALTSASVMKIVTSMASIELFGENKRFETKLGYDGKISSQGVLKGDLYIIGGGDPTLGSKEIPGDKELFLKDWTKAIKDLGIKSIHGDIIVIDDMFGYNGVYTKWMLEDIGTNYGQNVYGISIFDNLYTMYLNISNSKKKPKIIKIKPDIKELNIENRAKVTNYGRNTLSLIGIPLNNTRTLVGRIPKNVKTYKIENEIPNPAKFLGEYFSEYLKNQNILINGGVKTSLTTKKRPKYFKIITITKSPTLHEIVDILLRESNNHYTEHLYQLIKKEKNIDVSKYWEDNGFDTNALSMKDGCGLSRADTLSTKFLVDILKEKENVLKPLLPLAGKEGTVSLFLKDTPLNQKVRVKSGSMGQVQSFAGYVENENKSYAFAIIINHWNGKRSDLIKKIEKLLNSL